jgi:hypothetical protein
MGEMAWNEYEYRLVHPRRMIQGRSKVSGCRYYGRRLGARLCRYGVRYGTIRYVRRRYYRTVGTVCTGLYRTYIDQRKDRYCKGIEWVPSLPVQAKGKDAKHYRYTCIVRKRNGVQSRVGVECIPESAAVPLRREQVVWVVRLNMTRPMIRSRKAEPIVVF